MQKLQKIADILQKEQTDYQELVQAIQDYEALVLKLSCLELADETNRNDLAFENGKAIGSTWAAHCIRDLLRTKTFIKGIFKAVEHAKKHKTGPVQVLYVGTGPFATLILPILATYSESEIQVTLMEVNKQSFDSANRVLDKLGFRGYIKAALHENATSCVLDSTEQYDVFICETLQRALEQEQQVPILLNILPQLNPDVILVPEKIVLNLCLFNFENFGDNEGRKWAEHVFPIGQIFELSKEAVKALNSSRNVENGKFLFPTKSFNIPREPIRSFKQLTVLTEIKVWGEETLSLNESALTLPLILMDLSQKKAEMVLDICYAIDKEPGILYKLSESALPKI